MNYSRAFFTRTEGTTVGATKHWILRSTALGKKLLTEGPLAVNLRTCFIPAFMAEAAIRDTRVTGFRMVVDLPHPERSAEIHLIAGPSVPNFNPQDWRTPKSTAWDPNGPSYFFDACANTAATGEPQMPAPFGNQLYYAGRDRKYFGVADNDPKAEKHFLMLSQTRFGNMADSNFGELQWKQYFLIAGKILQAMGVNNWPIRLVTNFGVGFQQGARVHMHVMARQSGFASIFPDQYGFAVRSDGTVMASQEREDLQMIVTLIDRRKELQGNSEAVQRSRAALDQRIFTALQQIAHS